MADAYATFGKFLLLKRRTQDGLGTLWRVGEMERTGFKRIVWLRRFDQVGLDRAALTADIAASNQMGGSLRASNVVRNASCGSEGGVPYIAWDYVPAQPLDQLLARAAGEQFPDRHRQRAADRREARSGAGSCRGRRGPRRAGDPRFPGSAT